MTSPTLPATETLLTSLDDGVLHVTLNRPDRRNAMSGAMLDDFEAVFRAVSHDTRVRAIVMRGAGGIFCAGGDLKDFGDIATGGEVDRTAVAAMNRRFGDVFEVMLDIGAVVIAVVEKAAIGGGFGMACMADVVIAEPNATFSMTETSLGLVPAQIAPIVARRLGVVRARTLAMTAARLDAAEGMRVGLVDRLAEDLDAELADVLTGVRRCAPMANAATKRLMNRIGQVPLSDLLDEASQVFTDAILGEEAMGGIAAFLQKQPPPWAGESA